MPVAITIRNIPDDVRDRLASRAKSQGRSLQEYLSIELAELSRRPSPEDFIGRLDDKVVTRGAHFSAKGILAAKDADRA